MGGDSICSACMRGECQSRLSVLHYINADAHCGVCNTGITLSSISIILPAKNEAESLKTLLPRLVSAQPDAQIIVVDDGSTDDTRAICLQAGVQCLSSPYSMGNGARSEEHTSELQSLMRISYSVFCLKKKK